MAGVLVNADCFVAMKQIAPASIDLILTDPPFNVTKAKWDVAIDWAQWWALVKPIMKPGAPVVCFATQPFTTDLINSNRSWFRYTWVWNHHYPRGFQSAKHRPMQQHHDLVVFAAPGRHNYFPVMEERDKPVRGKIYGKSEIHPISNYDNKVRTYTHKYPSSILTGHYDRTQIKPHPSHKPESLLEYLINTYTQPGGVVFDPFCGSGSTGLAAISTGREYILVEKDEKFFSTAKSRLPL